MKPYGVPRSLDLEYPDLADIFKYGLKSSKSRLPSKSGECKNSFKNINTKSKARRRWARAQRIKVNINDFD